MAMGSGYTVLWRTDGTNIVPIDVYAKSCSPVPHYANWISTSISLYIIEEVDLFLDEKSNEKVINMVGFYANQDHVLAKEGSVVVGHVSAENYSGDVNYVICGIVDKTSLGIHFGDCTYFPFISMSIYGIKNIEYPGRYELEKFANEYLATSNMRIKLQSPERLEDILLALYIINKLRQNNQTG